MQSRTGETFVKIFGERNTGTNYLAKLIEENTSATVLPGTEPFPVYKLGRKLGNHWPTALYFMLTRRRYLGWKHSPAYLPQPLPGRFQGKLCVVTLVKNPYSWLLSLWRRPYHNKRAVRAMEDFQEFLATPWLALQRDMYTRRYYPSPVDIWNHKVGSYKTLDPQLNVIRLRYEDLLASPEESMHEIVERAGVSLKGNFRNLDGSTKKDALDNAAYRDYYLKEEWRRKLDRASIMEINRRLDKVLVQEAGYELLPELSF